MSNKVILYNGPKLSGKDISINYLREKGLSFVIRECKDKLHLLTREFFCLSEERYWEIYNDRSFKEKPLQEFNVYLEGEESYDLGQILGYALEGIDRNPTGWSRNLSIREAMIYVSEVICKPRFGENYFGIARAKSIQDGELVIEGSAGFVDELKPLIDKVGQENILLLRIHRDGFTFEGDSRNYIPDGVINNTVDIYNNDNELDYLEETYQVIIRWLNDKL